MSNSTTTAEPQLDTIADINLIGLSKGENSMYYRYKQYANREISDELLNKIRSTDFSKDTLPTFKADPPPRVIMIVGIGSAKAITSILTMPLIRDENVRIIAVENNPDVINAAINDPELTPLLMENSKVDFYFGMELQELRARMQLDLQHPEYAGNLDNFQLICETAEDETRYLQMYLDVKAHVTHNYGNLNDSLQGVEATYQNIDNINKYAAAHELQGAHAGKPALLIGAGWSLDAELDLIREYQDCFITIAVDAAVRPLQMAGITPDYACSIERGLSQQVHFWKDLKPDLPTELIAFTVVHPRSLQEFPGPKRIIYRAYGWAVSFEKMAPRGLLTCGGSAGGMALRMAEYMGCDAVVMVGLDSSILEDPERELYKTHCDNVGIEHLSQWRTAESISKKKGPGYLHKTLANDGSQVLTTRNYYQWAQEHSTDIQSRAGLSNCVVNTAAKGVQVYGADYMPLSEVVESAVKIDKTPVKRLPSKPIQKKKLDAVEYEIKGWLNRAETVLKTLQNMLTEHEYDAQALALCRFSLHNVLMRDSMYMYWVIQQYTREYYISENMWNRLPFDHNAALPERAVVLELQAMLAVDCMTKLLKILNGKQEKEWINVTKTKLTDGHRLYGDCRSWQQILECGRAEADRLYIARAEGETGQDTASSGQTEPGARESND